MDNFVGKCIDSRYVIHEVIGVGGMAVVYKAYDSIDDRIVAIKLLKEEYLASEEYRRRFKNESQYIAVLDHPNIVKVYDVHFGDVLQYIVMEYIDGVTLKEYLHTQGIIPPKDAIPLLIQILRALQHAHDRGIVHRDIKPQNIMLLSNGKIKVTDFGVASFSRNSNLSDDSANSDDDTTFGSVHYMSPEQAVGKVIDDRADIYSVGIVMYEMLTGQLPFTGNTIDEVIHKQIEEEPISIRKLNNKIPIGLEQIVSHAMEKNRNFRYQAASAMILDLGEYKRNPAVKFDYSISGDDPTRKINGATQPVGTVTPTPPPVYVEPEVTSEPEKKESRILPVLKGVIFGLIGVMIVILAGIYFFTDVFKSAKVEVPNFIGLNYENDVKSNIKYASFDIEVDYEYSSQYGYGVVFKQSPEKGKKVSNGDKILLTVNTSKTISVNDVYGQPYLTAKRTLEAAGFKTGYEMVYDGSIDEGLVISTSPERGEQAPENSKITIYVSTHIDKDAVLAPMLTGMTMEEAEKVVESVKLNIGEVKEEDSLEKKGIIIAQEPLAGDPVHEGNYITVTVSSGNAPINSGKIKVVLPTSSEPGNMRVYVNNLSVFSLDGLLLDGAEYPVDIEGSGKDVPLVVKINNKDVYSATVDFTVDPIVLTNVKKMDEYAASFYGADRIEVPNVVGLEQDQAYAVLKEKGFENIVVDYSPVVNSSRVGMVVSQSPSSSGVERVSSDTLITIYIGRSVF